MNSGLVKCSRDRCGTSLIMRDIYSRLVNASINAEAARHSRVLLYESTFPCTSFCFGVSRKIVPIVVHTAQLNTYAINVVKSMIYRFYTKIVCFYKDSVFMSYFANVYIVILHFFTMF